MSKKKVCPTCGIEKSLDEFRKDAQTKSGRACYCNACHRALHKRDRQKTLNDTIKWIGEADTKETMVSP